MGQLERSERLLGSLNALHSTGFHPLGVAYRLMITPACNCDAGAATESLDVIGMSKVATTPIPNTAIKISNISGLRFTIFLSLIQCLTSNAAMALFGAFPLNSLQNPFKMHVNVIIPHFQCSL